MAFDAQIKHWPTIEAFVAYLVTVPRPAWCKKICEHNTYIPNEYQWRGMASMNAMMATYIGKGWSAGPHLYLAAEAPNPSDIGIWQMTPLSHQGVHAGPCNDIALGVESVADWQARPPSPAQYQLLLDVTRAIMRQWMIPPENVVVHRECMPGRTCPGKYLEASALRADLAKPVPNLRRFRVRGIPIYQAQSLSGTLAGHLKNDELITIDKTYRNGGAHLADGRGFIDLNMDALEELR